MLLVTIVQNDKLNYIAQELYASNYNIAGNNVDTASSACVPT
jgi:hypothetical protein